MPFFQAYKTVLTAYPHTMLTASAPEVAAQIEMCAEAIRGVKTLRSPEPDDPFAPPGEEPYEMVRTTSLLPRDFRDWSLRECRTWRQDLLAVLARGRIAVLRHAVQHVMHERSREVWNLTWRKPRGLWRARRSPRCAAGPVSNGPRQILPCASVW